MRVKIIGQGQAPDYYVTVRAVLVWANEAERVSIFFDDWQCDLP